MIDGVVNASFEAVCALTLRGRPVLPVPGLAMARGAANAQCGRG